MADYLYLNNTGVVVADTAELRTEVQNEYLDVFGADMNTDASTPQGLLITAETIARKEVIDNNAALANQINPNIAGGVFLDAICALTGLSRAVATRSFIEAVEITGVASAIVPQGVRAKTADGDLFESTGSVIIALNGTATVDFQSVEFGAIPASANTLTTIVTSVLGWETVNNPIAAILGTDEQSDASLRRLRNRTLALQGVALVEAIISSLYAVPEVRSLQFRENIAATTEVIDGVTMVAHSIWACVDGGTDTDIGTALLYNKSNGAAYNNGATANPVSVDVVEPASGQTYTILFDRPDDIPFKVKATVRPANSLIDVSEAVKQAILLYAAGGVPNEDGFAVGDSVSPFEIAAGINALVSGVYVQKLEITTVAANTFQTTEVSLAIYEQASIAYGNIQVVIV